MSYGMATAIALGFATFSFAYLSVNFKDKHAPLKWFFMIAAVASIGFNTLVMSTVARNAGFSNVAGMTAWVAYGYLIILVMTIAYWLIYFIYNSLKKTTQKSYGEESGP